MNASRVKRTAARAVFGVTALAAFGTALLVSTAVLAQTGPVDLSPPKRLEAYPQKALPPPSLKPLAAPQVLEPVAPVVEPVVGADDVSMEAMPENANPIIGEVFTESLEAVNPDVAGVLNADTGALGVDMWQGTDRKVLEALLMKVPVSSASPVMRDLMRRLLLTGAKVPAGGQPGSLIALRAGLLLSMGDFSGVSALLKVVPGYAENPDLLRIEVDTRLLTGDVARACQVTNAYIENQSSTYWQKAFIFCQALEGKGEQAQLGMSLLQELGVEDDVFYILVDAITSPGEAPVIESLPDPTPLHLALARVAKATLPLDVISSNLPSILRSIAISPNAPPELRIEAAERSEIAGSLPVDALRQLYASIEFPQENLDDPLNMIEQFSAPMSRALLYRATLAQKSPTAQAESLAQALHLARISGGYASAARAFLPQIMRVEPTPELAWFAPEAIRAFLITNRHDAVRGWFELLKGLSETDPQIAANLESIMPLARLSEFDEARGWTMARLPWWWDAVKTKDGARDVAATLASVFQALGEFIPDSMWVDLIAGPSHQSHMAPHPSLWFLLDSASQRGRLGETILVSLVIMGEGGPAKASPVVLQRVLKALAKVDLTSEARAMALEAVVAVGL